jgi:hypothetical protein
VCIIFRSRDNGSRARPHDIPLSIPLNDIIYIYYIYVPRWNLYKSMRGRCADCASRFISFFRIYTQRIEWKKNIIPPARREKERSIYLQIFLLFAFPRAPSNKNRENVYARLRGSWFGKESKSSSPQNDWVLFEEFHPFFNIR